MGIRDRTYGQIAIAGDRLQQVEGAVNERVLSQRVFYRVQRHDKTVDDDQFHLKRHKSQPYCNTDTFIKYTKKYSYIIRYDRVKDTSTLSESVLKFPRFLNVYFKQ